MTKLETFDEEVLITNPFSYTLSLPVTEVISDLHYKKDPEDGLILNSSFYQEKINSVRIYHCEGSKQAVYNLSGCAQRLYLFILYNLKAGKDWFQINQEHYMSQNGIKSATTFKEARGELIRYNFIIPTIYKSVVWINPNLFFSGNRLKKYPSKIEVKQVWDKTNL